MKPRTIAALIGATAGYCLFIVFPVLFDMFTGILVALGVLVLYTWWYIMHRV